MLLCQDCGRSEHGDLPAVHDRLERSADGDFGFAKADVTADQPIHRLWTFHVDLGIDDRFQLVRCLPKRKRMFEFRLPFRIGSKCMAGMRLSLRLNRKHFSGVIENGICGVCLRTRPFPVAQRTERRRFFADTDVTRNQIGLLERHIKLRFIGKLERENFLSFGVRWRARLRKLSR